MVSKQWIRWRFGLRWHSHRDRTLDYWKHSAASPFTFQTSLLWLTSPTVPQGFPGFVGIKHLGDTMACQSGHIGTISCARGDKHLTTRLVVYTHPTTWAFLPYIFEILPARMRIRFVRFGDKIRIITTIINGTRNWFNDMIYTITHIGPTTCSKLNFTHKLFPTR